MRAEAPGGLARDGRLGVPVREVARRVGCDVKAVHRDMAALVHAGLLDRDDAGRMSFPYDGVRMEVDLMRAA